MATRRGHHLLIGGACALLVLVSGCGSDDARQDPRPPQTIVISAQISPDRVSISPRLFGAGRITLIVANGTDQTERLSVAGTVKNRCPSGDASVTRACATLPIAASSSTRLPMVVGQGVYRAAVIGEPQIQPALFRVGPLRRNSNDKVLLP
jgi:hypothetical protein